MSWEVILTDSINAKTFQNQKIVKSEDNLKDFCLNTFIT